MCEEECWGAEEAEGETESDVEVLLWKRAYLGNNKHKCQNGKLEKLSPDTDWV